MRRAALLLLALSGCGARGPAPQIHYLLGDPYEAGGVWRYPRESFELRETGLAVVAGTHRPYTADGEPYDPTALAAFGQTIPQPVAVVRGDHIFMRPFRASSGRSDGVGQGGDKQRQSDKDKTRNFHAETLGADTERGLIIPFGRLRH